MALIALRCQVDPIFLNSSDEDDGASHRLRLDRIDEAAADVAKLASAICADADKPSELVGVQVVSGAEDDDSETEVILEVEIRAESDKTADLEADLKGALSREPVVSEIFEFGVVDDLPVALTHPVINSGDDARHWFDALLLAGFNFHPDDTFADMVETQTGRRSLSARAAASMDAAMARCYEVTGGDPCAVAVAAFRAIDRAA